MSVRIASGQGTSFSIYSLIYKFVSAWPQVKVHAPTSIRRTKRITALPRIGRTVFMYKNTTDKRRDGILWLRRQLRLQSPASTLQKEPNKWAEKVKWKWTNLQQSVMRPADQNILPRIGAAMLEKSAPLRGLPPAAAEPLKYSGSSRALELFQVFWLIFFGFGIKITCYRCW